MKTLRTMMCRVTSAAAVAITLVVGACSQRQSPPSAQQPQQSTPPAAEEATSSAMQDCDMSGADMQNMTAEEHQKMMEECEKAQRASSEN